jgi:hypothetical protein
MLVDAGVFALIAVLIVAAVAAVLIGRAAAWIFLRASGDHPIRR